MIFKIKKFLFLIFLLLLQSCAGGRIGNFLESSFDNLENINKKEERKDVLENKKLLKKETKERKKKDIKENKKEERKDVLENKKVLKKETKERKKKDIKENKKEERKDVLENKKVLKLKKTDKTNKEKKVNNYFKKTKNELQSYKIIFILKDVDPKDPIKEFSTILRNSEVNFEIEKIERFLDSKK